jgi:hypothetical protein
MTVLADNQISLLNEDGRLHTQHNAHCLWNLQNREIIGDQDNVHVSCSFLHYIKRSH